MKKEVIIKIPFGFELGTEGSFSRKKLETVQDCHQEMLIQIREKGVLNEGKIETEVEIIESKKEQSLEGKVVYNYVLVHNHRFGSTPYFFNSNHNLGEVGTIYACDKEDLPMYFLMLIKKFEIEYEPHRDDSFELIDYNSREVELINFG